MKTELIETTEFYEEKIYIDYGIIRFKVRPYYAISLYRCRTKDEILMWVYHLSKKNWVNRRVISRFIELACDANDLDPYC